MEEWKEYKLGDISTVTKLAGYEFTKYVNYIPDGEIIAIRALNLKDGQLDLSDIQKISKEVSDGLERSKLYKNEIVLSYTGTIGACSIISENDRFHLAPNVCKITPNSDIDPYYLFYVIRSKKFQSQLLGYAHGSTQYTIPMKTIREIPISLCDFNKQHSIGLILKSFDDKIKCNRRINENLEQQAQALFKSWFVDFEPFKDQPFVESELGMIPQGWKVELLGNLIEIKYGKDHKKLSDGHYPVYGSGGLMRYVDRALYEGESVLVPRKGTLNNVMYVNESFWTVDTMFYSIPKVQNIILFTYIFLRNKDLASLNAGSAVPSMTTEILNNMQIVLPPPAKLKEFNTLAFSLYNQIKHYNVESRRLSELRDTLLPRLMSGEIKVEDVTF